MIQENVISVMEKERIINKLKNIVNLHSYELILALHGVTLDTSCDEQDNNLIVTELTTKFNGKLYGNTNWGVINLEDTITDIDDWFTLEDIVDDIIE
jgi:hypothetical protein